MLLQVLPDSSLKNMAVSSYPQMTQFLTTMVPGSTKGKGSVVVDYCPRGTKVNSITIPLQPLTSDLEPLEVTMHGSPTRAYKMPTEYSAWFSQNFGFDVVFAYLGDYRRDVLFADLKPKASSIFSSLKSQSSHKITFADCAPYLIVSSTSLTDVSARLPKGQEMDISKFRPNIVVSGAAKPWEEDYWGKLNINGAELTCAHNCIRCKSVNIDYATGAPGTGESGQVLKKLQKDRRVDEGSKWSPVFGRYSYWRSGAKEKVLSVGDEVLVTEVNGERTKWSKFLFFLFECGCDYGWFTDIFQVGRDWHKRVSGNRC
jgi:uncharacterized protein YcbX